MNVGLVIYGNINAMSGGFLYDRKIRDFLLAAGDSVETISLPWVSYCQGMLSNVSSALVHHLSATAHDVLVQDELTHPSIFLLNKKIAKRFRIPIISIVHHLRSSEYRAPWMNCIFRAIEKQYLGSVDGFIFNSCETERVVTSLLGRSKPSVIALPGGNRFDDTTITRDKVEEKALMPGPLKIIFIGNVIPRKGLHTLIEALSGLPRHTWRLTVVGDLACARRYVKEVKHHIDRYGLSEMVDFLGAVTDSELFPHLASSHILAVPSSYEGFGIVYLEAMAFGLPVIGSTAGGAKEIITHGVDGYLVNPGDARTLSAHINGLIEDRQQLSVMALAALDRFSRHPSWSDTGRAVHQFLHGYSEN